MKKPQPRTVTSRPALKTASYSSSSPRRNVSIHLKKYNSIDSTNVQNLGGNANRTSISRKTILEHIKSTVIRENCHTKHNSDLHFTSNMKLSPTSNEALHMRIIQNLVADLSVLRSLQAVFISCGSALFILSNCTFLMLTSFAMQADDHSLESAAWAVSLHSVINLIMRVLSSALSDWPGSNMRLCYVAGFPFAIASVLSKFIYLHLYCITKKNNSSSGFILYLIRTPYTA